MVGVGGGVLSCSDADETRGLIISLAWGGGGEGGVGLHSDRITLIVLTVSKYKACATADREYPQTLRPPDP